MKRLWHLCLWSVIGVSLFPTALHAGMPAAQPDTSIHQALRTGWVPVRSGTIRMSLTAGESFWMNLASGTAVNPVEQQQRLIVSRDRDDRITIDAGPRLPIYQPEYQAQSVRKILDQYPDFRRLVLSLPSDWERINWLRDFTRNQFEHFGEDAMSDATPLFQDVFSTALQHYDVLGSEKDVSEVSWIYCGEANAVFISLLKYFGYSARAVGIFTDPLLSDSHITTSVFVPSLERWVVVDPTFNGYWTRDQEVLDSQQLRTIARSGDFSNIVFQQDRSQTDPTPQNYFVGDPLIMFQHVVYYQYDKEPGVSVPDEHEDLPSQYYYGDLQRGSVEEIFPNPVVTSTPGFTVTAKQISQTVVKIQIRSLSQRRPVFIRSSSLSATRLLSNQLSLP